eukprot:365591-Chlamydomonas_euryale.AAC.1
MNAHHSSHAPFPAAYAGCTSPCGVCRMHLPLPRMQDAPSTCAPSQPNTPLSLRAVERPGRKTHLEVFRSHRPVTGRHRQLPLPREVHEADRDTGAVLTDAQAARLQAAHQKSTKRVSNPNWFARCIKSQPRGCQSWFARCITAGFQVSINADQGWHRGGLQGASKAGIKAVLQAAHREDLGRVAKKAGVIASMQV